MTRARTCLQACRRCREYPVTLAYLAVMSTLTLLAVLFGWRL